MIRRILTTLTVLALTALAGGMLAERLHAQGIVGGASGITSQVGRVILSGNTPVIGACGTSPSLVGSDSAMQLTVGTGGSATSCAATFSLAFTNAPTCIGQSNNTADALAVASTTTTVTLTKATALTASSVIHVHCIGR